MSSILITGSSKGVGRATAAELARRGHRVVATARDPRTLNGLDVDQRLRLDVTDQASVDTAIAQAGEIDVLISNAAVIFHAAAEASPVSEYERLYAQNTAGAIRVTQAVLPQMRRRGKGRLLYVSSAAGRTPLPTRPPSGPSKASPRHWPSRSPTSASTSPSPSRARSTPVPWTTCSPTASPATRTRPCSSRASPRK
jgi:NADP-dependent 3-hydroxy acid dehydrogenase YdfG